MAREKLTPKQWATEKLDRLEDLSISKVVPSALTLLGLCSGATAIRFAVMQDWKWAVAAIFFAMLFDMLDGRAARWLGADNMFGVQLELARRPGKLRRRAGRRRVHLGLVANGWRGMDRRAHLLRLQRNSPCAIQCRNRAR